MNIPVFKNQSLIFSAARNPFVHFLKKRARREMIILIMIMVVIGKYILKLGLSIMISPGSLPMGNFPSQGQNNPTARKISPRTINVFCILANASQNTSAYPSDSSCSRPFTMFPSASFPKCFITVPMACMGLLYSVKFIFSVIQARISSLLAIRGRYDSRTSR